MFIKTSDVEKHYHIAYVREDGTGVTSRHGSEDEGHAHMVYVDPASGAALVEEAEGHSHELLNDAQIAVPKRDIPNREEEAKEALRVWGELRDRESPPRIDARENVDFYYGKQVPEVEKQLAKNAGRPLLTMNEVRSKINILLGYQAANRTDIVYRPVESSDEISAEIYTRVVKAICEQNDYQFTESRAFFDAATAGRGMFMVYFDVDEDPEGKIRIEWFPWENVWMGPHRRMDARDCDVMYHARWITMEQAKRIFPDYADQITATYDEDRRDETGGDEEHPKIRRPGQEHDFFDSNNDARWSELINRTRKAVRLIERWMKVYDRAFVAANPRDDVYENLQDWSARDRAKVETIPGFTLIPRMATKMRITRMVADVVVDDGYPDLADPANFQSIPVYCYKTEDGWQSLITDMKDLQQLENKVHSQFADMINKISSVGWFYDAQTFVSPAEQRKFKRQASTPGFMIQVRNTSHVPVRAEPPAIPMFMQSYVEAISQKMREVSNINLDIQGMNTDALSGAAMVEKKRQALIGNSFLFDNLALSKKLLGRVLLRMIVKNYSPERVMRVLEGENAKAPVEIRGKRLDEYSREEIMAAVQNPDPGKFDVITDESPYSPTMRRANAQEIARMVQNGVPALVPTWIEMSDMPSAIKTKAVADMQAEQQAAAAAENKKYDTEIQKAQIAASSKAPSPTGSVPPQAGLAGEMGPMTELQPPPEIQGTMGQV